MQGRRITADEIELIQCLMAEHHEWGRTRLSEELCRLWNWRNARGRIKDMACRTFLLKLERAGCIRLPARRRKYTKCTNGLRNRNLPFIPHSTEPIRCALRDLRPLFLSIVEPRSEDLRLFNCLLSRYHYLGIRNSVGENVKYLIRDRMERPLGCALFGSAAWKSASRDAFIGWDRQARERNLGLLTNNTRLLILPWVTVPHLASHMLSCIYRRIRADWQAKYAHPVHALETFVDRDCFRGTCYKAANWVMTGQTQGRTRNDRKHNISVSIKDVYLYPLIKNFRRELCAC